MTWSRDFTHLDKPDRCHHQYLRHVHQMSPPIPQTCPPDVTTNTSDMSTRCHHQYLRHVHQMSPPIPQTCPPSARCHHQYLRHVHRPPDVTTNTSDMSTVRQMSPPIPHRTSLAGGEGGALPDRSPTGRRWRHRPPSYRVCVSAGGGRTGRGSVGRRLPLREEVPDRVGAPQNGTWSLWSTEPAPQLTDRRPQ